MSSFPLPLTKKCNFVLNPEHPLERGFIPVHRMQSAYSKPLPQAISTSSFLKLIYQITMYGKYRIKKCWNRCEGDPCDVTAKELDCVLKINEFKFKSLYYFHFQTNTLRKGMTSPPPHLLSPAVLLQGWLWH